MDPRMLVLLLAGAVASTPMTELRAEMEFEMSSTNLDSPAYRLQDTVQPWYQHVDLDVYLDENRFTGVTIIDVNVTAPLTQIVLHQNVVEITAVTVVNAANQPVALQVQGSFEVDSYFELLKINLAYEIPAGLYTLTISYLGRINENPLDRGLYKGYYFLNNERREYATTQFQPYHARKAFPCFDEPQFKNHWVISIVRDAALSPSYSNMAINQTETVSTGRVRETFLPTPVVSAYLVAFHISDFHETTLTGTEAKPFGIISRQGDAALAQHSYAAEIGLRITDELSDYLAFDYYSMGQGVEMKNDHIALPDFPSGAMENWGMVNYREAYLLYDEANMNLPNKIFVATIMAHELGHKWFGNLVTCFWWSNLWLNESFASFFEYFGAHMADPSLHLDKQFVVDYVQSALNYDAGAGATPMDWDGVVDNPSITAHFSTASYAKGASVLKMMEHFVGERNFRNSLRYYLQEHQYGIATPDDMYTAFRLTVNADSWFAQQFPGTCACNVLSSYVQNAGSPVLNVEVNMGTGDITITQERFLLSGATPPEQQWNIPVSWTHSGSPDFSSTVPAFVLTQRSITINKGPGHHWVIFNIQQSGLYRVNYDDHNWEMIAAALRNNRDVIHHLNRAQIVNDVLHFLRAGKIGAHRAFDVLSFLKDETDYYVWAGALGQLDIIRRRLEHLPAAHKEFTDWILESLETVISTLGYEDREGDDTSTQMARFTVMNYACITLGHEGCTNYATNRWQQLRTNPADLVPVNARRYVYCLGLRHGTADDYNTLFQMYNSSESTADMVVMLRTLPCTQLEDRVNHFLEQTLYNTLIRVHDKSNSVAYALQVEPANLPLVISFIQNRHQEISHFYGGVARLNTVISSLAAYLTDFNDIVNFQSWLYSEQLNLPDSFGTGVSVINTAISNLQWGNTFALDIFNTLRVRNADSTSAAAGAAAPLLLVTFAALAHLLR